MMLNDAHDPLYRDFELVRKIPVVTTMLEVICRSTGMGFSAIARVTNDRWLACCVRDEIQFGLAEGGELKIETTICNLIRDSHKAVVFDDIGNEDNVIYNKVASMYGFKSYISFPIILKNGEFFGTLCAIHPSVANVTDAAITGTFSLFAELIAFYLQDDAALGENARRNHQEYTAKAKKDLEQLQFLSDQFSQHIESGELDAAQKTALQVKELSGKLAPIIANLQNL